MNTIYFKFSLRAFIYLFFESYAFFLLRLMKKSKTKKILLEQIRPDLIQNPDHTCSLAPRWSGNRKNSGRVPPCPPCVTHIHETRDDRRPLHGQMLLTACFSPFLSTLLLEAFSTRSSLARRRCLLKASGSILSPVLLQTSCRGRLSLSIAMATTKIYIV